jgi:hypothetical protein
LRKENNLFFVGMCYHLFFFIIKILEPYICFLALNRMLAQKFTNFLIAVHDLVIKNLKNLFKKCVAYPQEDFLFTILYGDLKAKVYLIPQNWKKRYIWDLSDKVCKLNPKTYKSYRNTKSTNRNKKKSQKKSMFSTSKVKRRQKFVWGLPSWSVIDLLICVPDRVCRLNLKNKINLNQSKRKFTQKKYV